MLSSPPQSICPQGVQADLTIFNKQRYYKRASNEIENLKWGKR